MEKEYCVNCDEDKPFIVKEETIDMDIEDIKFSIVGNIAYCKECGEEVYISKLDDENVRKANEKYRELIGIIQTDQIKELADKHGVDKLAELLDCRKPIILKYLQGVTPSKEYSDKLKELLNEDSIQ